MAPTSREFYRSENGDRWLLIDDDGTGQTFVRHEPNLASGGRVSDIDVTTFLDRSGASPQHDALRRLLDRPPG